MVVYVDDMYKSKMGRLKIGQARTMKCSHMIASTDEELHRMAEAIGLRRAWFQGDHYDVGIAKRKQAIALGAIPVTMKELVRLLRYKTEHGHFPEEKENTK